MLIQCPECEQTVSDKAISCPHCGYPINTAPAPLKRNTSRSRKFQRLPNGFGSIKHLSGKRRNPYAAYPPTREWTNTSPVARPAIGYFATYNDAFQALTEYNKTGIEIENKIVTFSAMYELFMEEYLKKEPSKSALAAYRSAYKKCSSLYDRKFVDLKKADFQKIYDNCQELSVSSTNNLKKLFNQMYKIAIENDIVDRNYSSNATPGGKENEKGVPFTIEEFEKIWNHPRDTITQIVLIMIFSGFRAGELEDIEIQQDRFVGGLKTDNGKNRTVPIHPIIRPYLGSLENYKYTRTLREFHDLMSEIGISYAPTGEKHTPHDCRHTFSWLADKYKMDSLSKRLIMGHTLGNDVEISVYGHRTFDELKIEIEKICCPINCTHAQTA